MEAIIQSLYTTFGLLWKALWSLGIGYVFSSIIQVFISKKSAAEYLEKGTLKELFIAGLLGFVSSSCSFAALSATRSLYTKGASLVSALAYMFASTNLAIEVAALAQADVGIAIGADTDVAVETADIILVRRNPKDVVAMIKFAKSTYKKMIQNLIWATGYNVIAIPLAAGVLFTYDIVLSPALGAVLMSASTVIVAINAKLLKV